MPINELKNLGELCDQIGEAFYEENLASITTDKKDGIKRAIRIGYLKALKDWAWWHDGEERVGCGVYSYQEVVKSLMRK
jgi:hypothetical protein